MIRSSSFIHSFIDLPFVALIIKVSSATCNAYHHCSSFQIVPKSLKNFAKVHPKSTKIAPKWCPKSILNPKCVPKPFPTRFCRFFIDVLSLGGLPKSSQNRKKTKKSDEKSMSKKTWFSTPFFLDFSWFWPPKATPKSRFVRTFFEDVDFLKMSKNH